MHRWLAARRLARATSRAITLTVVATAALAVVAVPASAAASPVFPTYDSAYHTYPEMVAEIQATQAAHPNIVKLSSIGQSYEGRTLWVAKVSDNVSQKTDIETFTQAEVLTGSDGSKLRFTVVLQTAASPHGTISFAHSNCVQK